MSKRITHKYMAPEGDASRSRRSEPEFELNTAWLRERLIAMSAELDAQRPFDNGEEYGRAQRLAALFGYVCGLAGIKGKELADMLTPPSERVRR